jgi:hypothetical protein
MIVYLKWDVKQVVKVVVELFVKKVAHIVAMEAARSLAVAIVLMIVAVTAMIHAKVLPQPILSKTECGCPYFIGRPHFKNTRNCIYG